MTASLHALPVSGGVFVDVRGEGRALRVTYHPDEQLCVISIWHAGQCAATFRMRREDVPAVIAGLATSLAETTAGADTVA